MKTRNRRIYIRGVIILIGIIVVMCGCTDDMDRIGQLAPTDVLRFTTSLDDDLQSGTSTRSTSGHLSIVEEDWKLEALPVDTASSRATLTTSLSGNAQVLGYNKSETKLFDAPFTFDADELTSDPPIYWRDFSTGGQLSVYAFIPTDLAVDRGNKSLTYTIADTEAARNQPDIIVAKRVLVTGEFRKVVPLTFNHALTAVRFQLGEDITTKVNADDVQISLAGVYSTGKYTLGDTWTEQSNEGTYTPKVGEILMMIPQTLPNDAKVEITYNGATISTSIAGKNWEAGKFITYTLHESDAQPTTVYFDLAAGNVVLDSDTYSGSVYVDGEVKPVEGVHNEMNIYYVYQSSELNTAYNKENTGYATQDDYGKGDNCRLPNYPRVTYNNRLWSDFITNNTCVEDVIEIWDDGKNIREDGNDAPSENHVGTAVVRDAGRTHTGNYIKVSGKNTKYKLTIDNIYSVKQQPVDNSGNFRNRSVGGIAYVPSGNTELTVNFVGDNRMGCLHINDGPTDKITLQGTGTLTVADADFLTVKDGYTNGDFGDMDKGYISNFWNSAIGANTQDGESEKLYNLYIKSGVIFAGTTKAEDCTAIGGGGNGLGQVNISGGVITAVATTAGTAIGGGMGHTANGGPGEVHITGGNVYAYNFSNRWDIPSAAIGGGGSKDKVGASGTVTIEGGNIYAQTALGTAIGGGSSYSTTGGSATVTISGGYVVAKSVSAKSTLQPGTVIPAGAGIGGGTGSSSLGNANGGNATVTISGTPIIRTGSVGGGKKGPQSAGTIGSATINISGEPDIQAQFVLAKGTALGNPNSFTMSGGTIRNSNTKDKEYIHIQNEGGAVWLENGTCTIEGGTIKSCTATDGGAIYVKGGTVKMTGGTICDNLAQGGHGGGIYIEEGSFQMNGLHASIKGNSAILRDKRGGDGGGVYVTSAAEEVDVKILSGKITGNTSDRKGGGVCVDMSGTTKDANVTVGTSGKTNPDISDNHTLLSGGGLYVSGQNADIIINGGKIMGNTTSAYVPNEDVANEGGYVTLIEGDVTHNVVTFYSNGGLEPSETRNIVTATKGLLNNAPEFTRVGYKLVNWNTRADGNGDTYNNNEEINISADLELYAQWQKL